MLTTCAAVCIMGFLKYFKLIKVANEACDMLQDELTTTVWGFYRERKKENMRHMAKIYTTLWQLVIDLLAIHQAENDMKQTSLNSFFANISKSNICDIRLIPLDHVTYAH